MRYKGFEFYATEVPEEMVAEMVAEGRAPIGAGKVFACEIYRAEDGERMENVLKVVDLVVGRDIADGSDETLVFAMMGYIDDHYGELYAAAVEADKKVVDERTQSILNRIDSGRITETANVGLCFDHEDGRKVICVDFCYDSSSGLPACDVDNLLMLPVTGENIQFAQAVLRCIGDSWKVPMFDSVSQEVANDPKTKAFRVFEELMKLQETAEYQVAAVMAYLNEHCDPDVPLSDDELYALAEKYVEVSGSWFGTTASQQEYLIAFADLLECGISTHNNPDFSELGPIETRKLLLDANEQVFGTLVESAAVANCYRYLPDDYSLGAADVNAVENAIERALVGNVGKLIETAAEKAGGNEPGVDIDNEKLME